MTASTDITRDAFLSGTVTVVQPAQGYRAGLDAVLLAAAIEAGAGERIAEAGTGAGAALLCAARRLADVRLAGFERDAAMIPLVREGIALNGFADRAGVEIADVSNRNAAAENAYDQSFANPPYFEPGSVRAPSPGRQSAYLAEAPLKDWVLFLHYITRPGGRITLIHRAAALADLLELLNSRTGEIEVLPVRPAPGAAAHRVLVRGRKGLRRGPVRLYDGLVLHETVGGPSTPRAASVLAGGALDWR
ncbi:MAG: SAM-dependent methyltransferase [Alphaproteobacteria bacterium]|nr:SAM-dependent methyltransferase [Alphaproteobacteria bacterium]